MPFTLHPCKIWPIKGNGQYIYIYNDYTLPETNRAPENRSSQKEFHLPSIYFEGLNLVSGRVFLDTWCMDRGHENLSDFQGSYFIHRNMHATGTQKSIAWGCRGGLTQDPINFEDSDITVPWQIWQGMSARRVCFCQILLRHTGWTDV